MKLRTKLTVFSILLLAAAIALCCAIIISFAYQGEVESITSAGISDFEDLYREFVWSSTDSIPDSPIVRRSYIINKFRSLADAGEFVLQKGDEFWVNNTGFDVKSILPAGKAAKLSESGSTQYKLARIDGADYFIAASPASIAQEDYYVSLMRNVTPQINSVRSLAAKCALVGAVITAIAAYAMHLIVLRSLLPIKALQEGANQLSGGKYAERIPVHGHDELSELAADFNSMAEAIEGNMQELNERAERQQAFINDLSHELKTPVTSILLSSETLLSRSFRAKEFACKDGTDPLFVDSELVQVLQAIRDHFGAPVVITSGYRTAAHNRAVGGAVYSQHQYGRAADIRVSGVPVEQLAAYAETLLPGTGGIGRYPAKGFVHVDVRKAKSRWAG